MQLHARATHANPTQSNPIQSNSAVQQSTRVGMTVLLSKPP